MQVSLLKWPTEEDQRAALRRARQPRLLLVEEAAPAPMAVDPEEDWVRLPASDHDIQARVDALTLYAQRSDMPDQPTLDRDGLLRHRSEWVALPPIEARLIQCLMDKAGAVVSRDALIRSGWPDEDPTRNVLDVHVLRLRRRIEPLLLEIRTVRSRGYVLEV